MMRKYSIQAHQYSLKRGPSLHSRAKQTPGEQSAPPTPAAAFTCTLTRQVPSQKGAGLSAQVIVRKSVPFLKTSSSSG